MLSIVPIPGGIPLRWIGNGSSLIRKILDFLFPARYSRREARPKRTKLKGQASRLIDRDRLNSAPKLKVAEAMVKVFATVQNLPRETQLLALAAAFVIQSEALGFPTSDAYAAIINLMKDPTNASGRDHRFDAMKFHIETELNQDGSFTPA